MTTCLASSASTQRARSPFTAWLWACPAPLTTLRRAVSTSSGPPVRPRLDVACASDERAAPSATSSCHSLCYNERHPGIAFAIITGKEAQDDIPEESEASGRCAHGGPGPTGRDGVRK